MDLEEKYNDKCWGIQQKGGTLYLIERVDTNEYLHHNIQLRKFHDRKSEYKWLNDTTTPFLISFLTKEDADKYIDINNIGVNVCPCCGGKDNNIDIISSEHLFINSTQSTH